MLPDGAHQRTEDWTIFYLNQTRATTVKKELSATDDDHRSSDGHATSSAASESDLLYVMSLVRTKHGSAYKRWAALPKCSEYDILMYPLPQRSPRESPRSMQSFAVHPDIQGAP